MTPCPSLSPTFLVYPTVLNTQRQLLHTKEERKGCRLPPHSYLALLGQQNTEVPLQRVLLYNTDAHRPSAGIQEAKQDSPTFLILLPFKRTSHVFQAGLKLPRQPRATLNFCPSCLHVSNSGTGLYHHTQFCTSHWDQTQGSCMLGRHRNRRACLAPF